MTPRFNINASALLFAFSIAASAPLKAQGAGQQPGGRDRTALEQSVRQRFFDVVKRRLSLTDEQMTKLQATNQKSEARRLDLLRRERAQRVGLRAQIARGDSANQRQVADLVDGLLASERERLDITIAEQKELANFMTPVQRGRYLELQNQLRRRAEDMRRKREGVDTNRGPGRRP